MARDRWVHGEKRRQKPPSKENDHLTKRLIVWVTQPKVEKRQKTPSEKICWEKLKADNHFLKYQNEVEKPITGDQSWPEMMKVAARVVEEVCGLQEKRALAPWLEGQQKEIKAFQKGIAELSERIKAGEDQAREKRRRIRREHRRMKRSWEEEWWLKRVEDSRDAEVKRHKISL